MFAETRGEHLARGFRMRGSYVRISFVEAAYPYSRQKANYCRDRKIAAQRNEPSIHTMVRITSGQHKQQGYYDACGNSCENSGSCDALGKKPEYHAGEELCDAGRP